MVDENRQEDSRRILGGTGEKRRDVELPSCGAGGASSATCSSSSASWRSLHRLEVHRQALMVEAGSAWVLCGRHRSLGVTGSLDRPSWTSVLKHSLKAPASREKSHTQTT